ncbi:cation transporter [Paraburkholderia sp. C35]|uniref:cation transporter n=1 Tax=Paraburkholderia sp. C35 TaxID=2126993 RepID=UPI00194ED05E|nr:cation transporter [Paraburkholderia sp. C35]
MQPVTPDCDRAPLRAAYIGVLASVLLMALQLLIGWLAGSSAIVADGTHTLVDLLVDALLFSALHPRGKLILAIANAHPARTPAALCATLSAVVGAGFLLQGLASQFDHAESIAAGGTAAAPGWAILMALLVLVIRESTARRLDGAANAVATSDSGAAGVLAAGAWHARIDALSACVAAVGAAGVAAGFGGLDHIASALIGLIMVATAVFQQNGPIREGFTHLRTRFSRLR